MKRNGSRNKTKSAVPLITIILFVLCISSGAAFADTFTFTVSGIAASDGRAENAEIIFSTTSTSMTIAIINRGGPSQVGGISSEITGVQFTLSAAPTSLSLTQGMANAGTVDCSTGKCIFNDAPLNATSSTPFGWTISNTSSSFFLVAGAGSFKPDAITNQNATATDGNKNARHNPMLVSSSSDPVTFNVTLTGLGSTPAVGGVIVYFGTCGDIQSAQSVPEPDILILLGIGFGTISLFGLRRKK